MNNNRFSRQLLERVGITRDVDDAERKFRVYEGVSVTAEMLAKYDKYATKTAE